MDVFSIILLIGGLAFFLYGMHVMSSGLEKMAGSKLESLLRRMTDNPLKGLALGAAITVAIQSSSALTVMLVGLVNSGIMQAGQTAGAILGAHVGTTLTSWILSLSGIRSDNVFLKLLKPENFSLVFALIGVLMIMMSKRKKRKDIGSILVGFAILMYGMKLMQDAMSPLKDAPWFTQLLTLFENPLLGVLIGAVLTGLIQSSAASIGILQALSLTGSISYKMAIPLIVGLNIGTCVTALISSIGVSREAKKVSAMHIASNAIGGVVCLAVFYGLNAALSFAFVNAAIDPFGIALVHTVFNIATTILWLPFLKFLTKLGDVLVPAKRGTDAVFLDERIMERSPAFALSECDNRMNEMAVIARDGILDAINMLKDFAKLDEKVAERVREKEDEADIYEDKLGDYLVKLSAKDLNEKDAKEVSRMLHAISDFERISDHSVNLVEAAEEMREKDLKFSEEAMREIGVLLGAVTEIIGITTEAYINNDTELAKHVEPLEQVVDDLTLLVKSHHIDRLQKGDCTIGVGFVLNDILGNVERVSDHCSNIAIYVIELETSNYEAHNYLDQITTGNSELFKELYAEYQTKYSL